MLFTCRFQPENKFSTAITRVENVKTIVNSSEYFNNTYYILFNITFTTLDINKYSLKNGKFSSFIIVCLATQ